MTWLELPDDTPFGITNLPYGIKLTATVDDPDGHLLDPGDPAPHRRRHR